MDSMRHPLSPTLPLPTSSQKRFRILSALVAFVLAAGSPVLLTTPASAASATLSVPAAPNGGGTVTVTGSGFDQSNNDGYKLAVAPANYANYAAAENASAFVSETTFVITPTGPQNLSSNPKIEVLTAGAFSLALDVPPASSVGWKVFITHALTPNVDTTVSANVSYSTAPTPTISVRTSSNGQPTNLEPTTTTSLTITGTGFVANPTGNTNNTTNGSRPPLSGKFAGVYVVFGKFGNAWQPSSGAASSTRTAITTKWGLATSTDVATVGGSAAGAFLVNSDGSFTTTIDVSTTAAQDLLSGNYGIYTYPGSGAKYAAFETYTPVSFLPRPTVTISQSTLNIESGTVVTVTGTGFTPRTGSTATRPPLSGNFGGVYVAFGRFADVWKPSASAPSSSRKVDGATTKWAVLQANLATVGGAPAGGIVVDANGNFTTTLTLSESFTGMPSTGNFGIYTYSGSGANAAAFETYTPVTFATPAPTPTPTEAPVSAPTSIGYVSWGVDAGFREYIVGRIAKGNISVSQGATASGNGYNFGQSGTNYNFSNQTGTADYSGSVRFYGHSGSLDLTFANPTVVIDSASSGVLYVSVNGSRVALGTVNLSAAGRGESGGAQLYTNAPVTLTPAGAIAFNGFYPAGRALSPITFQVGLNGAAPAGAVGTVSVVTVKKFTPPATPPATTGITLAPTALRALTSGAEATISVSGYQPNESGIAIVVYSTPTVLAENLTADANGIVTWTGKLPADLEGNHTLTVQGSVVKGIALTVAGEPEACVVSNTEMTWGFKESFLAYLDSSIANGSWGLTDVTENADNVFVWSDGSGDLGEEFDAGTIDFEGSVLFTGHSGALNTTIANPRLVFTAENTADLYLDVTGTTQQGADTSAKAVKFATVSWSATEENDTFAWALTNGVVTLTEEGAAAFGTYPTGELMDPLTLAGDIECAGAEAAAQEVVTSSSREDSSAWIWILASIVLAGGGLATVLILRRRSSK